MCSESRIKDVLSEVLKCSKKLFAEKLVDVILCGSYARGDNTAESDIDIVILAHIDSVQICDYLYKLREGIYKLEIEKECVISLCIVPYDSFVQKKDVLPFYRNIEKEGIRFAG